MLYEWRETVQRKGPPVLKKKSSQRRPSSDRYMDFRQILPVSSSTSGNLKNLNGRVLYSDMLLIDIDKEENKEPALKIMDDLGLHYTVWTTGNRGIHCHVYIKPMQGVNVVYSQQHWLKSVGLWQYIDNSIYRPSGQFRAPGATHSKTNKVKRILREVEGRQLEIKMLAPPPVSTKPWDLEESTPTRLFDFYMNLLSYRGTGGQTPSHVHSVCVWTQGRAGQGRSTRLHTVVEYKYDRRASQCSIN